MTDDRPSASWIRDQLHKMENEKRAHKAKFAAQRPDHWHMDYDNAIRALHWAAIGYDNLAKRDGE